MAEPPLGAVLRHVRQLITAADDPQLLDSQLLQRFTSRREEAAFAALVRRHGPMVLGVCQHVLHHRQDAEDAFQATFLVLARQAASVRKQTSLASWLHGVAFRTALGARRAAARRRKYEGQARCTPPPGPSAELTWREVETALAEEIERLPEKFRAVFVLCCQEGRSREQAARQLGLKEGTVSSRLSAARQRLRHRLARRGLSLGAVLGATAVAQDPAVAAVPAALADAVVKAALRSAAGETTAAAASSATVAALVQGVTRSMVARKLRTTALVVLLGFLAVGAGVLAHQTLAGKPHQPRPAEKGSVNGGRAKQPAAPREPWPRTDAHGDPLPEGALARLGTVRLRHQGRILKVTFGPGGKTLLSCCQILGGLARLDGSRPIQLWDVATGKAVRHFTRPNRNQFRGYLRTVAYSPDGWLVAAAFEHAPILLWDAASGAVVREINVQGMDVQTRGRRGGRRRQGRVRDLNVQGMDVQTLVFSPDNKALFCSGGRDQPIRCFEVATGKELRQFAGHPLGVHCLAVSPSGKILASAGSSPEGHQVAFWDAHRGTELRRFRAHRWMIGEITFSPDSLTLASASTDGTACLWDVATGKRRQELRHPRGEYVHAVAFAPGGKVLATGSSGRVVRFWDVATGRELRQMHGFREEIRSLAFSPDGKTLAAASGGAIQLRDVTTGRPRQPAEGHHSQLRVLACSPTAPLLASAGDDRVIVLWDVAAGKEVRRLAGHAGCGSALAFSPDGKVLASGGNSADASVRLWDVATGKELARLGGGHRYVSYLMFAPDGKTLASGDGLEATVRLWQLQGANRALPTGGKLLRQFKVARGMNSGMALAPNLRTMVSAEDPPASRTGIDTQPNPIRIRDLTTGKEVRKLEGHRGSQLRELAFSPDSRLLASAGHGLDDRFIRLWDVAAGKEIRRIEVSAWSLAFSPDGKTLATVGLTDSAIRLWEVDTGLERGRFPGHPGRVVGLAFTADGRALASAGMDTTVLLWDVTGLARAKGAVALTPRELKQLWDDLAGSDGRVAYRAVWRLAAGPREAVPFLKQRLLAADANRITRLIRDLDSDSFRVRLLAREELAAMSDLAEPYLQAALEGKPSVETRPRIETLLKDLPARPGRVVEVLEHSGTPAARRLLATLARGKPQGRLARAARAALRRSG
jgi:RNA polymerase sigma factor (sigma-70 family)